MTTEIKKFAKINEQGLLDYAPRNYKQYINFNLDEELLILHGYKEVVSQPVPDVQFYRREYEETETQIIEHIIISEEDAKKNIEAIRSRLDEKELTPSDVERALLDSTGMDFEDLKVFLKEKVPTLNIKAIGVELRANTFFRGATLKDGTRLFDTIGKLLGYTEEDLDNLFETKTLPSKIEE